MKMHVGKTCGILLFLLLQLICTSAMGQQMSVSSFKLLDNDLTANTRSTMELDQNGEKTGTVALRTVSTAVLTSGNTALVSASPSPSSSLSAITECSL